MKAMIFAAGKGTRLRPLTDTMPKALLPLAGKTLLEYQILKLKDAGISDIIVNVHHFANQIVEYLELNHNFGCNIAISDETEALLETGGGLKKASWFFQDEDAVLVCNCDILSNINLKDFIAAHQSRAIVPIATIVVSPRTTQRYLLFDENNALRGWTNIKTGEIKPAALQQYDNITIRQFNKLAFSGMQVINPTLLKYADGLGDKFSLIDLYLQATQHENITAYIPKDYRMMDVGKIEHLQEAEQFAKEI